MVIDDLHSSGLTIVESKHDAILIVDSDAPVSSEITVQCFQPVARRNSQILDDMRRIELVELALRYLPDIFRNAPRELGVLFVKNVLGCLISEADYHQPIVRLHRYRASVNSWSQLSLRLHCRKSKQSGAGGSQELPQSQLVIV